MHKFPYKWNLADGYPDKNGYKVFSTFACGGGSTMGYKLAGFDVLGMNEIDPKMAECYIANHNPRHAYVEPIQDFKNRDDLPPELYDLDILDGSPPCSSFSMAGNREKDWGKEKKFREGQAEQVLDTLFFDFIDLAEKLQPKIVVAENVKGILLGAARDYVWAIRQAFDKAGYHVEHWTLDASKMGVPQRRERVFFIALRKDLIGKIPTGFNQDMFSHLPELDLEFCEDDIPFGIICDYTDKKDNLSDLYLKYWDNSKQGEPVGKFETNKKLAMNNVATTITTRDRQYHPIFRRRLNDIEICQEQSYPIDYNFLNQNCNYICGMSVPPVMTAQIAIRIKEQWLDRITP